MDIFGQAERAGDDPGPSDGRLRELLSAEKESIFRFHDGMFDEWRRGDATKFRNPTDLIVLAIHDGLEAE